jgi:hypothetical protein
LKTNNYRRNIGSISHATMRPEDLIPDFIWELRQMKPLHRKHRRLIREIEARKESTDCAVCLHGTDHHVMQEDHQRSGECEHPGDAEHTMCRCTGYEPIDYWSGDDVASDLEALFDALDEYAPPYFYFGAHPGDGSDYGFWLREDLRDDPDAFDGLRVSGLDEVPADYIGEILEVNDHGNVSLYVKSRNGRLRAVWGIV